MSATRTPPYPPAGDLKRSLVVGSGGIPDTADHLAAAQPHNTAQLASGPSWLCEDEATRRRMLDMEHHLRPARAALFAVLATTLVVLGPSIGWWPLAPFGAAAIGFSLADKVAPRSRRPEYCFIVAWAFSQMMIGISVVFTGGPRSIFLPWLAIPAATLSARFNARGVVAGVVWTAATMIAVTVGVNPTVIAHTPQRLLVPLTLLAGVTILSSALMRSDVKHRAAAAIDPLTGLFNRQALTLRAAELVEQARVTETPVAVMIGDLDHFKDVNDLHGHMVGDQVLREVANTLRTTLRTFDYIYRYGGEEFVILLPGSERADALATAERLRVAVAGSQPAGLRTTMSIGISVSDGDSASLDDLLIAADRALYGAKADGRNRVCADVHERSPT
jgi:diguanylate cyclase (GGDEF)-like protein